MVICLEQGADLHMAQLMLLPLTVSSFSKIQIGFTFLVAAHLGSPGKRAVKRVCASAVLVGVVLTVPAIQPLPGLTSATVDSSMTPPPGATVGHDLHLRINPHERSVCS